MRLRPLEDAIRAWVKTATGFSDGQVYFANQNGSQPAALPYITILISGSMRALGAYDEQTRSTDLSKPNGQEITLAVTGQRDLLVSIQAFAENTVSYAGLELPIALPGSEGLTAVELLTRVQTALSLESVRQSLNDANLAPYDIGEILRVDAIIETFFEGRAVLNVRMYSTDQQSESTGYIKEVQGTGDFVEAGLPDRLPTLDVVGS